jgi:serine protein kinase
MNLFDKLNLKYQEEKSETYSLREYLDLCKLDRNYYKNPAERMLDAIGEPELVDTSNDPRLSRIFMNKTLKIYPSFSEFYGMEEVIERLVSYFVHAAQGLEEKKQILYLLGPVGGGKSSLAEKLKQLMERRPIYVLAVEKDSKIIPSPVFESPLGLFDPNIFGKEIEKEYGIPPRYLSGIMSPWARKRLDEFEGDISKFKVVKMYPSKLKQIAIMKTEPGDENNQDISSLVGKVDLRMLDKLPQNDPDAYSYSGALNRGNQGLVEFVEMFKAPIKTLHPLLTATQEGNYTGTEEIGPIPFNGIILAHSNESEWLSFKNNRNNEAFLDRIYIVKVPYCLRVDEEKKIYKKMIDASDLKDAPCAPETLEMLAQWSVLTRLKPHENSNIYTKMRVYNGENVKDTDPNAKTILEYKNYAGIDEGMTGMSTRFAYKVLSKTFNYGKEEISADPVKLMFVLEDAIKQEQLNEQTEKEYINFIKNYLAKNYAEFIGNEIQKAFIESYDDFGQNIFDRYVAMADNWIDDIDYKDPETGEIYDRAYINKELEKIEKPAGITNPKDFRQEIVKFVLKARSNNNGKNPHWTSYEKIKDVIEKKIFASSEELLPVISFGKKKSTELEKKHEEFIERMKQRGYTLSQIRRLVEWYMRVRKNS